MSKHVDAVEHLADPSRYDVYRDRHGQPVTITEDQMYAIWHAISVWESCNERDYRVDGQVRLVDLRKSCLLGRMLFDGKAPFDVPPPRAYSAPWYSLIEDGHAGLCDLDVTVGTSTVIVCQMIWQRLPLPDGESGVRLTYDVERGGVWRLTADVPADCPPCGHMLVSVPGHRKDEPVPCDWWLERV